MGRVLLVGSDTVTSRGGYRWSIMRIADCKCNIMSAGNFSFEINKKIMSKRRLTKYILVSESNSIKESFSFRLYF